MRKALFFLIVAFLLSCGIRVATPHRAVFTSVKGLMRDDTTNTGFFTNASLFDSAFDEIEYRTKKGTVVVKNEGGQNFLACRYDPITKQLIWIATGGGSGGDGGVNYFTMPPENAVYVVGYFEGTAYFPKYPGAMNCDSITSRGMADMFIAKYSYDKGVLQWVQSGGSSYSDVVFTYNGTRHTETYMTVDSAAVTVYANFFGPAIFDGKSIDSELSGSALQIIYDKESGEMKDVQFATTLPELWKEK